MTMPTRADRLAVVLALGLLAACIAAALAGCVSRDEQRQQTTQRVEREQLVVGPVSLATPLGPVEAAPVRVERVLRSDAVARETAQATTSVEGGAILAAAGGGAASGGLLGWLGGAGGIAAAAWAWIGRRRAERALTQVVAGVEDAKERLQPDQLEKLLESLDSCMDSRAKALVRDTRAEL